MKDNQIATCDPFNPPNAPCPSGYSCQWSLSNQRYQCCGNNSLGVNHHVAPLAYLVGNRACLDSNPFG